ncbi:hypothetical protein J3Q64DRAFT_1834229 [Phycomyces blakesleeanus]|uniref:Uncharacterized protein n=1 Tax=Phycomyces blakesleeanus TaxID=4837 RepID=A0ABR3AZU2_PHYBL
MTESLTHHTSKQLRNHKRIYKTVNVHVGNENLQEPAMKSAPAQTNIEDVPFDPFQSRTFKASCNFKAGDQGHVYNDNIFTNNTFTTSELFSIGLNDLVTDHGVSTDLHSLLVDLMNMVIRDNDKLKEEYNPKVLHAGPVNTLIKSKTDLKSYEYDICENVCLLFDITKDEDKCSICKAYRYKEIDGDSSLVPVNIMKMMSIGDQLARLLGNDKTRAKLQCRANRQSISNKISDYFDGEEYKTLKEQQLFDSPNDIAIALCTDEYLIQLAIIPGKPKDLDSFLLPIIDEISSLGKHGLIIKKFNGEQIKAKVHMVMASGDIPQVTQFCHHTGHMSNKGCRICEVEGVSPPHGKGKYYQDRCATLRTKDDFVGGKKATGIKEANIFARLPTFSGSCFYGLDEMHLIGHGIGKLIYKLVVLSNTESLEAYWPKSEDGSHFLKDRYTFSLKESDVKLAGRQIQYSRSNIPVSFQGSWDNIIDKREGVRAIDYIDFLLYVISTLLVPLFTRQTTRKALLALVKGCSICLQWNLNENMIVEMENNFNIWHQFLDSEITEKIYQSESSLPKVFSGKNAGNLVERLAIRGYLNCSVDFDELVNPIIPTRTSLDDFLELSSLSPYNYDHQLWSPFETIPYIQEFTNIPTFTKELQTFYI